MPISDAGRRRRARRRRVFELRLMCWTVDRIAAELGVCEKTVDRDIATPGVQARLKEAERRSRRRTAEMWRISTENLSLAQRDQLLGLLMKPMRRRH